MKREVSDEELAEALAAGIDRDGNDVRLAKRLATMTPEERAVNEENLRRWIEAARTSLQEPLPDEPAEQV